MKKIYTTFFNNMDNMGSEFNYVSVANRPPRDFNRRTLYNLAPDMVNVNLLKDGTMTQFEFNYHYGERLKVMESEGYFKKIIEEFKKKEEPTVLVCHEDTLTNEEEFCHRHLLRPYFEKNGIELVEYQTSKQLEKLLEG